MSKPYFHTLLKRYQNGECTPREKRLVEQWFALLDGEAPNHTPEEQQQVEDRIWRAIQQKQPLVVETRIRPLHGRTSWRWAAAAAVVLAVLVGGYRFWQNQQLVGRTGPVAQPTASGLFTRTNSTNQPMVFRLSDGTEVRLSPLSRLEFPREFDARKREVFLTGKAFFNVAKNPERPFLVYTGEVVTKVLGTSFWVDASETRRAVEVSVVTGRVSVFQRDARDDYVSDKVKSGVILTPNQRVTYAEESRAFVTGLVEKPVLVAAEEQTRPARVSFVFDDAPLGAVVERLETAYGIEIILENERLARCLFTADLTKQPLFAKLDLLCAALNADYEVRGTTILLSGKGCAAD